MLCILICIVVIVVIVVVYIVTSYIVALRGVTQSEQLVAPVLAPLSATVAAGHTEVEWS
jgi:hypothetical protein